MLTASLMCLSIAMYHEARGEPVAGQIAVANVIMNRVKDKRFPKTVCGVITEGKTVSINSCQFSFYCDDNALIPKEKETFSDIKKIASKVLKGEIKDNTQGALFFHTTDVKPKWSKSKKKTVKIDNHIFYK